MIENIKDLLATQGVAVSDAVANAINAVMEKADKRAKGRSIKPVEGMLISIDRSTFNTKPEGDLIATIKVKQGTEEFEYEEFTVELFAPVGLVIKSKTNVEPEGLKNQNKALEALITGKTIRITKVKEIKGWGPTVDTESAADFIWNKKYYKQKDTVIMSEWEIVE
jgi:hypothetical protein